MDGPLRESGASLDCPGGARIFVAVRGSRLFEELNSQVPGASKAGQSGSP
jgi:hypothetical protein